jgi:thymidylate kinase
VDKGKKKKMIKIKKVGLIIGLTGKSGVGKDTFAGYLAQALQNLHLKVHEFAFADALKVLCGVIEATGRDLELEDVIDYYYTQEGKAEKLEYPFNCTRRELLITLGQAIRSVAPDYWIAGMMENLATTDYKGCHVLLITDVRMPNEAAAIRERNGLIIRMLRDQHNEIDSVAETALDKTEVDVTVDNNGTIEQLAQAAQDLVPTIMRKLKLWQ